MLPDLPRAQDGEPVFAEPWQAQAFALVLSLHQRGLFTWPEWAQALAEQIASAQARGDADLGDTYYRHWLAALEAIVASKGAATHDELTHMQQAWDRAAERTPHGQPIELQAGDWPTQGGGTGAEASMAADSAHPRRRRRPPDQ